MNGAATAQLSSITRRATNVVIRPILRPDDAAESAERTLRAVPDLPGDDGIIEQQSLELVFSAPRPFTPVVVNSESNSARMARPAESWESDGLEDPFFERQPTSREHLPEPKLWAQRYGQAWVEVLAGRRPAKQLSPWSTPSVLAKLSHRCRQVSSSREPRSAQVIVTGIRVDEPADGVAEVAAVVRSRHRCRALMLRLEGWDGRWVCTYAAML